MSDLRKLALFLSAVLLALIVESYLNGPSQWSMKYDFSGKPIATASRDAALMFYLGMMLVTNSIILLLARHSAKDPTLRFINIPNKEYWARPENAHEALRRVDALFSGVLLFVNCLLVALLIITRLQLTGAEVNIVLAIVPVAVGYLIFWTLRLFKPLAEIGSRSDA